MQCPCAFNLFYLFHGREGIESIADHSIGFRPNPLDDGSKFYSSFDDPSVCLAVDGDSYFIFLMWAVRIPSWQYEVVKMEGHRTISKFRYLWFPNLGNLFLFAAVFLTVEETASFSGAYVMLGGSIGILDSGLLFVTYLYQVAFPGGSGRFDFPTAAAMSVLVVPLVALVLFGILRIRRSDSVE